MATRKQGEQGVIATPKIKIIRSLTGSDYTFPNKMVEGLIKSLTAPWDRAAFLPPEFTSDPYVLDAQAKGFVEIKDSDKMPTGPGPYPQEIEDDAAMKGWLTSLLYGPYTEQFQSYLKGWIDKRLTESGNKGAATRVNMLKTRILPLVRCALKLEPKNQNRQDLITDLKRVEQFIVGREWEWDVQSTGRGNTRP